VQLSIWVHSSDAVLYGLHCYLYFLTVGIVLAQTVKDEKTKDFIWASLRVLLLLTYLNAGYSKLMSILWQSGDMVWYLAARQVEPETIFSYRYALLVFSWATILVQLVFPIRIFTRRVNTYLFIPSVLMHIGIMMIAHIYLFSCFMIAIDFLLLYSKSSKEYL
jgi:hypothetical protein